MSHKIEKSRLLAAEHLPPEFQGDFLPQIQARMRAVGHKIVVLDDDPTGTQTVYGIPVLTHWSLDALSAELMSDHPVFYLLTNSRSLASLEAQRLAAEIGANLRSAARQADVTLEVISRSDSTLRGHFPGEVDALARAMGIEDLPCLIIPCFFEGGRYTADDIHYVAEQEWLIPAADTAYARDSAFGYRHSNLRDWVAEKTAGRITRDRVASISLEDIRAGGPQRVEQVLSRLAPNSACVVNALSYKDLEVFVLGLLRAQQHGHRFLFRTAASFVRVRAGLASRALLNRADMLREYQGRPCGGLFVVGSYVPKTTGQVACLLEQPDISGIEVRVDRLLEDGRQAAEVQRVCREMNRSIRENRDVLIYTSRELVKGSSADTSLSIGRRVSDSLIDIVKGLQVRPRYLVAKGGITSSDVATQGLGIRRAMVMGQLLPGVPVWRLGEEARYPGMGYVVFPGNVGEMDALVEIKNRLGEDTAGMTVDTPSTSGGDRC